MSAVEVLFLIELNELFKKYGISIDRSDDYDGDESFRGATYSLYGPGIDINVGQLEDRLRKLQ